MDKYTATEMAYKHGYEKGYEAGYADCLAGQRWIPVSERMPERLKVVLCLTKDFGPWVAGWDFHDDELWSDGDIWLGKSHITHWMPLPEPPKEGE